MTAIRTTCPYCGVGCGVAATVTGPRSVTIAGDTAHPANAGRLCSKGTHLGETVGLEGRLLHPMIGDRRVFWDAAMTEVAERFAAIINEHGPDSVAFYVSGQLLTEDYYAANKLMKGFIGSGNIDTNSRLCMSSAVAAHNRAFGEDVVPCSYSDLEEADLILLVGSNTAWCHPVVWQRIEAARARRGTKLVVIDPRRTETAEQADLHIAVEPDGDVALFNALLHEMRARDRIDRDWLTDHCVVPDAFWSALSPGNDPQVAALADLVAAHPRMVTLFSQGANQSRGGTDKGNAILNLHLALGRIGKPGMGPFSITGQPNAMGGREVGGLANMLACHLGFDEGARAAVADYWDASNVAAGPGLKAVDLFRAVDAGRVKALWVMATNPAMSMPDAGAVRAALDKCEFLVVSEVMADTDTARRAHVRLPALAWGEKDGTVTNSERVVSRQRPLFQPPGEARADWAIVADLGRRLGHAAQFAWSGVAELWREYAGMTRLSKTRGLVLDLTDHATLDQAGYDEMAPFQWGGASPYAEARFGHADGKARLVAVYPPEPRALDPVFPLRLNTGRYRDQWHSMSRTGLSPRLSQHRREPLLEIHPEDALAHGLSDDGLARVSSPQGDAVFRVAVTDRQRPGEMFAPMHWTDLMSSGGRTNRLPTGEVDPLSGQPGFKDSFVAIAPVRPEWRGFLVSRSQAMLPPILYWTRSRVAGGWLVELAGEGAVDIEALLPAGERMEAVDLRRGMRRVAVRDGEGRLEAALFVTRDGVLPPRDWIVAQLARAEAEPVELLAGRPTAPMPDRGPIVCVCFDVGTRTILQAIADQRLASVEAVGAALRAGTNCGSCRPIIKRLVDDSDALEAAE